ncbi:hypothetical protein [Burkholderia pseudomallei]|uniref:hypothetical protein n=1 Tax=Burkholderia pseudomallei TaxID=28450 RepID=UPI000A1A2CE9|nr:hypothetical protein [Burkholderia pseudomallei]ARL39896.1 hypothetical protein BOC49_27820 [Burkholderia pseudomallei]
MNIAQYLAKFPGQWSLERVADVLARLAKRDAADQIEIGSLDHASSLIREQREEISILKKSLERVQAKRDEFCAATARLEALMQDRCDELIASAREGREPDYRDIDDQLVRVREVLAQYADEQVNVPAAIASIESTLSEAEKKASAVLLAAQKYVSRYYQDQFEKAHKAYLDFINSEEFIGRLENMRAMLWLHDQYADICSVDRSAIAYDPAAIHTYIDRYLEGIRRAGGEGILNRDRTNAIYQAHAKNLQELAITSPNRDNDSRPNPLEADLAKRIQKGIEEIKMSEQPVNTNH